MFNLKVDNYIYLLSTRSTNQSVQDMLSKNNPVSNLCLYTDKQTQGRGQIGRNWFSDEYKNLTLSYLFNLNLSTGRHFDLNIALTLALSDFLRELLPRETIKIKWPNDIYVGNNKIAGILIQNMIRGKTILHSILGIGININQEQFPEEIPNPVSVRQLIQKEHDLIDLVFSLEAFILNRFTIMSLTKKRNKDNYIEDLFRIEEAHEFILNANKKRFMGIIKGVSEEGQLIIEASGQKQNYNFREISFII